MIRTLFIIVFLLFKYNFFYGQGLKQNESNSFLIYPLVKTIYHNRDTLSIKIKNKVSFNRGFTIEAVSLSKEPYYYSAVYSAYLNFDKLFFKKLEASKKSSGKNKLAYILPDYVLYTYAIRGNEERTINFIIKGTTVKKGILLRLEITSDSIDNNSETIYSNPFYLFSLPE